MNNSRNTDYWLTEAQAHLASAERAWSSKDYKVIVHYAQLALEFSAKTVISKYHEPEWSHDPSDDLLDVIRTHGKKLERRLGKATMRELRKLAADAKQYAEWHILSTYGRRVHGQRPQSPDELCTPEIAAELMPRARHAVSLAARFVDLFA